jgi:hypothetical protein
MVWHDGGVENGGKDGGNILTDGAGVSVRENCCKSPAVSNGSWIDSRLVGGVSPAAS